MDGTVLLADDDRTIRTVLVQALTRAGCKVHATSSLTTLMRWVAEGRGDAVITDVMMPDGNGLEMLPKIAQDRPGLPVIVISAQNSIMTAIRANEAQAFDYLPKPFDLPDLMKRTARALKSRRLRAREDDAAQSSAAGLSLIGGSAAMQALYRIVARVMNADMPVLITGEAGTGKTRVARLLHDLSDRRNLPCLPCQPTDLRDADAAERLLGRVRGGTVLLEDPAALDDAAQRLLVRIMDAPGQAPPRFVATVRGTGPAPEGLHDDLYHRLAAVVIPLPALRERMDDIAELAAHFLRDADGTDAAARPLSEAALGVMRGYSWPGNLRQMENLMRRLALNGQSGEIGRDEIAALLAAEPSAATPGALPVSETLSAAVAAHLQRYFDLHEGALPPAGLHARILREVEQPLIEIALAATGGNQARCAELLGINRNTLRKKITELDIRVTRARKLM